MPTRDVPLDALPDPAVVVDRDGEVRAINRAGTDRWGAVAGESLGSLLVGETDEGDLLERTGADSWQVETRVRGSDGRSWLAAVTVRPLNAEESLVVARDVTQQRKLERDRGMLDALLEHTPVAVYFKDRQSRYVRVSESFTDLPAVNDEGKCHPTPADLVGKTTWDVFPSDVAERMVADDRRVIEDGEVVENREQKWEAADGSAVWHSTSKVPWYGENDAIRGLVGVTVNVTERERYADELERQNERLEDVAEVVSHDLRNPLEVASGALELYRGTGDEDQLDRVARMHERMERLVDDTLELARSGELVAETEPVDLSEVAADAWAYVDTTDGSLSIECRSTVEADRDRLCRLFENLFRNAVEHGSTSPDSHARQDAVEHGPASPRSASPHEDADERSSSSPFSASPRKDAAEHAAAVRITVGSLDDGAGFYVADDGPGIPGDERDAVFDRAYTTSDDGTGFGLSIVREIVEAHGWTVEATESADGGARFDIRTDGSAERE